PQGQPARLYAPLQAEVKSRGLWAAHLPPELGGQGFGQVKLGLMHEILGTSPWAPNAFGNQAPDSGNSEILAMAGTPEQKERWLHPLLAGDLKSAFSMTEPEVAGSDPTTLRTSAVLDGDEWVINGHKWFSTNGSIADFLIVMVVTDPDARPHQRASMIIVPADTPGVNIVRDIGTMEHPLHDSFGKLGNHADILCERSLYRQARGGPLAEKQTIQNWIADSAAAMQAARLMTLHAAWKMDTQGASAARQEISLIKFYGATVMHDVIDRALQAHGA